MEEQILQMIRDLRKKVAATMPDEGAFEQIYVQIKNTDGKLKVTDWMLKVKKLMPATDRTGRKSFLELVAYKLPSIYIASCVLESGIKQDILARLDDEDSLTADIRRRMQSLARSLEDV